MKILLPGFAVRRRKFSGAHWTLLTFYETGEGVRENDTPPVIAALLQNSPGDIFEKAFLTLKAWSGI